MDIMRLQQSKQRATGVAHGRAHPRQVIQSAGRINYSMQQVSVATQVHSRSPHLLYIICTLYACYDRVTNKIRRWNKSVPLLGATPSIIYSKLIRFFGTEISGRRILSHQGALLDQMNRSLHCLARLEGSAAAGRCSCCRTRRA